MKLSYKDCTDNELITAIRGGDNGALDFLLNKYKNLVKGKAKTFFLIGGDRGDLIQEGMIGLYMAIRDYDFSGASFASFADLCTTRKIYNAIESSNSQKHKPLNDFVSFSEPSEEGEEAEKSLSLFDSPERANPELMMIRREEEELLLERLKSELSPVEMQVLELYLQDCSYRIIAEKTGKSEKAIDNAVQRIRKKLKKMF